MSGGHANVEIVGRLDRVISSSGDTGDARITDFVVTVKMFDGEIREYRLTVIDDDYETIMAAQPGQGICVRGILLPGESRGPRLFGALFDIGVLAVEIVSGVEPPQPLPVWAGILTKEE